MNIHSVTLGRSSTSGTRGRAFNSFLLRALAALLVLAARPGPRTRSSTRRTLRSTTSWSRRTRGRALAALRQRRRAPERREADDPDYLSLAYLRSVFVSLVFVEQPQRVLVVGSWRHASALPPPALPAMQIDCVELDPEVIAVARQFFGFARNKTMRAYAGDAGTSSRR